MLPDKTAFRDVLFLKGYQQVMNDPVDICLCQVFRNRRHADNIRPRCFKGKSQLSKLFLMAQKNFQILPFYIHQVGNQYLLAGNSSCMGRQPVIPDSFMGGMLINDKKIFSPAADDKAVRHLSQRNQDVLRFPLFFFKQGGCRLYRNFFPEYRVS